MTNHDDLLAVYDAQLRHRIPAKPSGRLPIRGGRPGASHGRRTPGLHRYPSGCRVTGPALDALIAEQRDFFAARGESVEWKTRGHDEPADLPARLIAAGFVPEERETVVIGATDRMAVDATPPTGVVIRSARGRADFERIAAMETAVWGEDLGWMADDLEGRVLAAPDETIVLVAEANGNVVSAAWLVFRPGTDFASLWGGSTLERWRGRGIYKALVAHRARLAAAQGVRYLQVDASDDSRPILERLGFEAITTTTPYVWSPASIV